jgi:hypothetical protein
MHRLSLLAPTAAFIILCGCSRCFLSETHINRDGLIVDVSGSVEFADDDRDVKSITPGGFVRISRGSLWTALRSYEVRPDGRGGLAREYIEYGRQRPLDAAAERWVADGMLLLIRETGSGAEARVQRMLRNGGPPAVLLEARAIQSDGSKRRYLRELLRQGSLTEDEAREVMQVGRRISSDGDKSGLLMEVADLYLRPHLREPWFAAVATISSDGDKRRVLQHAVAHDGMSPETLLLASKAAGEISSDGDKAAVLSDIARGYEPEIRAAFFRAVNSISSDGDRCRVLSVILRAERSNPETVAAALHSAATVSSDGDKAAVLSRLADTGISEPGTRAAFFEAANSISSDGDHATVLLHVLRLPGIATETAVAAIESAARISSDGDKAKVLLAAAEKYGSDPTVRAALRKALQSIQSDGDYRRVSDALIGS